jgi:Zn-dependent dipeptidase, microsomal dipeptidase homolog
MPFFDFHLHPTLKSLFSENNAAKNLKKFSPWIPLDKSKIPFLLKCCTEFPYIIESQGNLAQLAASDCNLVCVALYIPEKSMLTDNLIEQSAKSPLGIYLQTDKINSIINGNPYSILRTDDWPTLTNATQFSITNKKVKPLKTRNDFNENDSSIIHAVFSVEGCHTLSSELQNFDVNAIITNLDDLRSNVSLISVNITHLEQSPLCNHAFGMQFLSNDSFKPTGNKISEKGITVLKHCYENKIMVDIKHLSLGSRMHLYELRNTPEFANINQPIICTHAGFTGISIKEIPNYVFATKSFDAKGYTVLWQGKPVKYGNSPRPSFNASSINLYDEDIFEILNSGGMLGFSLDKRILGYQEFELETNGRDDFPLETEYISNKEKNIFLGKGKVVISKSFEEMSDKVMQWDEIEEGGVVDPFVSEYHLKHFMAHVVHVIVVAKNNNYDVTAALNQICIGSDYDGLINPVWICETANSLDHFKSEFEHNFLSFAKESDVDLPAGFDVKSFSKRLFFENGRDFVLNRLDILNA